MLKSIDVSEWIWYSPKQGDSTELRSCLIKVDGRNGLEVDARSPENLVLNGVTADGQYLYLDSGNVVSFHGRLVGFAALEIVCSAEITYRIRQKGKWLEKADPTKVVIESDEAHSPMKDMFREELRKFARAMALEGIFKDDESVMELYEDFLEGDVGEDPEPDEFGLGHTEEDQVPGRTTTVPRKPRQEPEEDLDDEEAPPAKRSKAAPKAAKKPAARAQADSDED